jgi:hypothetical protein
MLFRRDVNEMSNKYFQDSMVTSPEDLYLFNAVWLLYIPMSVQSVLHNTSNLLRVANLVAET